MSVVFAVRRHDRPPKQSLLLERQQHFVITLPGCQPFVRDPSRLFQLGQKVRRGNFAGQKRRTDVLPSVFVNLAPVKPAAIGSFFTQNFGTQDQTVVVYEQATPFAGAYIFCFMKTEAAEIANANVIRVSTGSMTPSSHSLALA